MGGETFAGRLLALRLFRLGRLPPAEAATELAAEAGIPVTVVEYGEVGPDRTGETSYARIRWGLSRARTFGGPLAVWLVALWRLAKAFRGGGAPRLVLAHGLQEQAMAWVLHRLTGVPYAAHVHEIYDRADLGGLNRLFLRLEGPALRGARFLVFPEATRARLYAERYRLQSPILVAYNCPRRRAGTAPTDLRAELRLPRNSFLIGYLGGIGASAALEEAIEALASVPQAILLVWGWGAPGYLAFLRALAERLGVASRVLLLGEITEKWRSLAGLDLSYCVYRPDSLRLRYSATASNKLMESLAVGVGVVVSERPDYRSLVENEGVGIALPTTTASAVAIAIQMAMEHPELRAQWRRNATAAHQGRLCYEAQYAPVLDRLRAEMGPGASDGLNVEIEVGLKVSRNLVI